MVSIMGGSGGLAKANHAAAGVAGGLVAVVGSINVINAKYTWANSANFTWKSVMALSSVVGPDIAWAAIGGSGKTSVVIQGTTIARSSMVPQQINPQGILNPNTFSGIALLVSEWALKEFIGTKYGLQYAYPWFTSIGAGLVFSGIFGGIFDPGTGVRGGATAGSGPAAVAGSRGSRTSGFQGTYSGV